MEPTLESFSPPRNFIDSNAQAQGVNRFAKYPVSWYFFCLARELKQKPVSRSIFGRKVVVFRTDGGRIAALEAKCSHLGADLGGGIVKGETIRCPFHHWEYAPDGACTKIPASRDIPCFAQQTVYPVQTRHGFIFVFNAQKPLFPLPFYSGTEPSDLICGKPYTVELECPWYMVGANAFDAQHFRGAHDRELLSDPQVTCPSPFSRKAQARFGVVGGCLQDRLTRILAGDQVELAITDHAGNFLLATASFKNTRTFGMVATTPLGPQRVRVHVFVMKRKSSNLIARWLIDPLSLAVRRQFINRFLGADIENLRGVDYDPERLIEADKIMGDYFSWLSVVSHGTPFAQPPPDSAAR